MKWKRNSSTIYIYFDRKSSLIRLLFCIDTFACLSGYEAISSISLSVEISFFSPISFIMSDFYDHFSICGKFMHIFSDYRWMFIKFSDLKTLFQKEKQIKEVITVLAIKLLSYYQNYWRTTNAETI